jgi:hypothetical protein
MDVQEFRQHASEVTRGFSRESVKDLVLRCLVAAPVIKTLNAFDIRKSLTCVAEHFESFIQMTFRSVMRIGRANPLTEIRLWVTER